MGLTHPALRYAGRAGTCLSNPSSPQQVAAYELVAREIRAALSR